MRRCFSSFLTLSLVTVVAPSLVASEAGPIAITFSGKCIDVEGGSKSNGAQIIQKSCQGASRLSQMWTFVAVDDRYYQIKASHSDKCMGVEDAAKHNEADVVQMTCGVEPHKLWRVTGSGDTQQIINKHKGFCLDVYGRSEANGADIHQYRCYGGSNQYFEIKADLPEFKLPSLPQPSIAAVSDVSLESVNIVATRLNGKCLDVEGGSTSAGAQIVQYDCLGLSKLSQIWTFVPIDNVFYQIRASHSNKCMGVEGASKSNEADVVQMSCGTEANKLWRITGSGAELYIRAKHSDSCLDVYGRSGANNADIHQYKCYGGVNQYFEIKQTEAILSPIEIPQLPAVYSLNTDTSEVFDSATITSTRLSNKCLDVENQSTADGAQIVQYDCLGPARPSQVWVFVPVDNEFYHIKASHSNKCMGVKGASSGDEVDVVQMACGLESNKLWRVTGYGTDQYIRAKHSNKCLEIFSASRSNNADIHQYRCYGGTNQFFEIKKTERPQPSSPATTTNTFEVGTIVAGRLSGKCLDVESESSSDGAQIVQYDCLQETRLSQKWIFVPVDDGYYQIMASHSKKCMGVKEAVSNNEADIVQLPCGSEPNKLWRITGLGDDRYIRAKHSDMCLDVYGRSKANNADIHQYRCYGGSNQFFRINTIALLGQSDSQTSSPIALLTSQPTEEPSPPLTNEPTTFPTSAPTATPTAIPTSKPTTTEPSTPTFWPTSAPTPEPTTGPSPIPSPMPTDFPTTRPSIAPGSPLELLSPPSLLSLGTPNSSLATELTAAPTQLASREPTGAPTGGPTNKPTRDPSSIEYCVTGFVMDKNCINRGTLLDSDLPSLSNPDKHTIHCMIDIDYCRNSGYEMLTGPIDEYGNFSRHVEFDSVGNERFVRFAKAVGVCDTCDGVGSVEAGLRATVKGTINLNHGGPIPQLLVEEVLSDSVACPDDQTRLPTTPPTAQPTSAPTPSPTANPSQELTASPTHPIYDIGPILITFSGKCVDVEGQSTADGAQIVQFDCLAPNRLSQMWTFIPVEDEFFQIRAGHSEKCIAVKGAARNDEADVVQLPCGTEPHKLWRVTGDGANQYIIAKHTDSCLDIFGRSTANNADVHQYRCYGGNNQYFELRTEKSPLPAKTLSPPTLAPSGTGIDSAIQPGSSLPSGTIVATGGPEGIWEGPFSLPFPPASCANLKDGRILFWSSNKRNSFGRGNGQTFTMIFDPDTHVITEKLVVNTNHDMFCPGTSVLATGEVMITGGTGDKTVTIYDPRTDAWSTGTRMTIGRGYHSNTVLADGAVLVAGGSFSGRVGGKSGEIWSPLLDRWDVKPGLDSDVLVTDDQKGMYRADNHYWMFQAPNGKIFHAGPSKHMHWLDRDGDGLIINAIDRGDDDDAMTGIAMMFDEGKILTFGGAPSYEGGVLASNRAYVINVQGEVGSETVVRVGDMHHRRTHLNGVLLPSGEVVALGGVSKARVITDLDRVMEAELWDPETGQWRLLPPMRVPRNYHSVAALLQNGAVLAAGGGLCGGCRADHPDLEIYYPPYLFNADGTVAQRPTITSWPNEIQAGQTYIDVDVPNANAETMKFALVRLSATTHSTNNDQRRVSLDVDSVHGDGFRLRVPTSRNILVPGSYWLFAMHDGVPSVAVSVAVLA